MKVTEMERQQVCLLTLRWFFWSQTFFKIFFFFLMWTILKVLIEFAVTLLLFFGGFFDHEACSILAPHQGWLQLQPCIGRRIINHWTTREDPRLLRLK